MDLLNLPSPLDKVFTDQTDLSIFFDNLMHGIVDLLRCDRCYLYIRDPKLLSYQIPHCYCANPEIPSLLQTKTKTESFYRSEIDPLFAAAVDGKSNIFIENIETLAQQNETQDFWQKNYQGHKSLIQSHLLIGGELWGIIQAAQFSYSRPWNSFDRSIMSEIVNRTTPLLTVYVR